MGCTATNPAQQSNENTALDIHIPVLLYSPWEIKKASANSYVQNTIIKHIAVMNFKIY